MALMDFFNKQQPANNGQPPQNQQQQQPNQPQGGNIQGGNGSNGATTPNMGQNNGQGGNGQNAQNQGTPNPLDSYGKLWDNPSSEGNTPPTFSIDPKIMDQVVSSQDFTKGIDPAVMQRATSGDVNALMEIIQSVGRNSYRASIEHGGMLTDKFVGAREQHSQKGFSSKVRQELTTNALSNTPNFKHPVVRKQLTDIAERFSQQHPDAAPEEIAEMAKKYLGDLVSAIQPQNQQQQSQEQKAEKGAEYWDNYFNSDDSFTSH